MASSPIRWVLFAPRAQPAASCTSTLRSLPRAVCSSVTQVNADRGGSVATLSVGTQVTPNRVRTSTVVATASGVPADKETPAAQSTRASTAKETSSSADGGTGHHAALDTGNKNQRRGPAVAARR